jgi:predicted  nucleic acid-binding Zn-ribbon protein
MARSGTKPGKGSYECSRCGALQTLRSKASTLKAFPDCGSTLFRKAGKAKPAASSPTV